MRLNYIAAIAFYFICHTPGINASSFAANLRAGTYMVYLLDPDHPQNDAQLAECIKKMEESVVGFAAEGYDDDDFGVNKRECMRLALSKPRQLQLDVMRHINAVETAMHGELKSVSSRLAELQKRLLIVAAPYLAQDPGNRQWVKSIFIKMKELADKHLENVETERNSPLVSKLIPILRLNIRDMCPPPEAFDVEDMEEAVEFMIQTGFTASMDRDDYKKMLRDMPELNNDYEAARRYDNESTQQLIAEFEGQFAMTG